MEKFISLLAMTTALFLTSVIGYCAISKNESLSNVPNLRTTSYDGKWIGVVKCLYDPGIWPEDECDVTFTFDIKGDALSVEQVIRSKKGEQTKSEINPGKFQFVRLITNAVARSIESGNDDDGTWVETWLFGMTLNDQNHMTVHWTRIVNNLDMPLSKKGSKFSSVGMGEFVRIIPAP